MGRWSPELPQPQADPQPRPAPLAASPCPRSRARAGRELSFALTLGRRASAATNEAGGCHPKVPRYSATHRGQRLWGWACSARPEQSVGHLAAVPVPRSCAAGRATAELSCTRRCCSSRQSPVAKLPLEAQPVLPHQHAAATGGDRQGGPRRGAPPRCSTAGWRGSWGSCGSRAAGAGSRKG